MWAHYQRVGAIQSAVIAGDLHHYSRYEAKDAGTSFVTAGGGGATIIIIVVIIVVVAGVVGFILFRRRGGLG